MINIFLALSLFGCPAELQVSDTSTSIPISQSEQQPEIPPELGVIERDDCDQKVLGSSVCNFILIDQNGEYWSLYDHKGKIIILDFSTAWCYPCQIAGNYTQPIQDQYASDVVFVTLLIAGESGADATAADVQTWVEGHNITTAPVLQASREYIMDQAGVTGYLVGGYPTYVYLDKDLKIANAHVGFSEEYMKNILDGMLQ